MLGVLGVQDRFQTYISLTDDERSLVMMGRPNPSHSSITGETLFHGPCFVGGLVIFYRLYNTCR